MAEEGPVELEGRRKVVEEPDVVVVKSLADPDEHVVGALAGPDLELLAVGVTPQPVGAGAERAQPRERLGRERPVDMVATEDDCGAVGHLRENRLERRQVRVNVVEGSDLHRPRSVNSATASSRVALSSAPS